MFDPEQMRARFLERIQSELEVEGDEWTAMEPLVEDVLQRQRDARTGFFGFMGRRPGGFRGEDRRPEADAADPEADALRAALENKETPAAEISAKLKAFRKVRQGREADLAKAREKLREVLTVRQEATLVLMGILE